MAQGPLAKKFKGSANKRTTAKPKSNSNKSSSHGLGPKKGGKIFSVYLSNIRIAFAKNSLIFYCLIARSIAPKKQSLIKQKTMQKVRIKCYTFVKSIYFKNNLSNKYY
jgi:hypothetical protein